MVTQQRPRLPQSVVDTLLGNLRRAFRTGRLPTTYSAVLPPLFWVSSDRPLPYGPEWEAIHTEFQAMGINSADDLLTWMQNPATIRAAYTHSSAPIDTFEQFERRMAVILRSGYFPDIMQEYILHVLPCGDLL